MPTSDVDICNSALVKLGVTVAITSLTEGSKNANACNQQYAPMRVEEQVVAIYAAAPQEQRPSWIRQYPVADVGRYEEEMLAFMKAGHAPILEAIAQSGQLKDEVRAELDAALDAFGKIFEPSHREAETEASAA